MAYSNSSSNQASSTFTYRSSELRDGNKKGKAARDRRRARRNHNFHSPLWGMIMDNSIFNEKLAVERASQDNVSGQVTKLTLSMYVSHVEGPISYWYDEYMWALSHQADLKRYSKSDMEMKYRLHIYAALEAAQPSLPQKVWKGLNTPISLPCGVEEMVKDTAIAVSFGLAIAPLAMAISLKVTEHERMPQEYVSTPVPPLVQQFIQTIEEETQHLR